MNHTRCRIVFTKASRPKLANIPQSADDACRFATQRVNSAYANSIFRSCEISAQEKKNYTSSSREAVANPDSIVTSFLKRKLRQKRVGDKILEVVTITEGSEITVITGYYLEEES